MKKLFLPVVVLGMLASCRRYMVPDGKEDITQARAVTNMNPLAGTPVTFPVQMETVSTMAGGNWAGNQDGVGDQASFRAPSDVAEDASGNVYIADAANNLIRKMSPTGVVTTFAGDGQYGWKDGAALSAEFKNPTGIAVAADGAVYVADQDNNRIRKIATDGTVSTVAGTGVAGFADGAGNLAKFSAPADVAVDGTGVLYVADFGNNRIRRISTAGVVTQWCGSTAGFNDGAGAYAQFNGPMSLTVAPSGVVYVADYRNNRVRKIASGVVTTLAGGMAGYADGAGGSAKFNLPVGVAVDASGNVYVTDDLNGRIRKVTPAGVVTTLVGSFTSSFKDGYEGTVQFDDPRGIIVGADGMVYIADRGNNRIRKMMNAPAVRTLTQPIKWLNGLAIDGAGILYASSDSGRIIKITPDGNVTTLAGGTLGYADGTGTAAKFEYISGLATDLSGNVLVADYYNNRIRKITPGGVVTTFAGSGDNNDKDGAGTAAGIGGPNAISVDPAGNMYVVEAIGKIRKITPAGVVTTLGTIPTFHNQGPYHDADVMPYPGDIKYGVRGLLIPSWPQHILWHATPDGTGFPDLAAGLYVDNPAGSPTCVEYGQGNVFYVGKYNAILKYTSFGGLLGDNDIYAGYASAGYLDAPNNLALFSGVSQIVRNPATHVLYVVDHDNERIRMLCE